MFLQALIDDLNTAGIGTFGTDMFASGYPSTAPDSCLLLRSSSGAEPLKDLPVEFYMIQVLSRALNYPAAESKAWEVFRRYHGRAESHQWLSKHNYSIGSYYVAVSRALQIPSDISPDAAGRSEVSFNIMFRVLVNP